MKSILLYLFVPLWTFTSVQQEIRSIIDGQTEIINAKVDVVGYTNKICFVGKITECHYIVERYKNQYVLANRSIVIIRESRVVYNDDYETSILYKEKVYPDE